MRPSRAKMLPMVVLALSLATSAFGQSWSAPTIHDHQKLMHILKSSLKSDIHGVVESTIFTTIQYKSYYPNLDFSGLIAALDDLSQASSDSSISFKAHLATMYLRYGDSLDDRTVFDLDTHENAFQLASEQLTKKFLFSHSTQ
jgi:hypothetical protein